MNMKDEGHLTISTPASLSPLFVIVNVFSHILLKLCLSERITSVSRPS